MGGCIKKEDEYIICTDFNENTRDWIDIFLGVPTWN